MMVRIEGTFPETVMRHLASNLEATLCWNYMIARKETRLFDVEAQVS